ncbi:hypothetical protein GCM10028805_49030 [Spirosoma harenae]
MTTYLLSKEVHISGNLANSQGSFSFLLNRNASSNGEFYELQQESNRQFDNSISEYSYLGESEFQTKFTYNLDSKGKITAKVGLECLDELIPITQLFNDQIESVTVIEDTQTKTFAKSHINTYINEIRCINEWEINTVINKENEATFKAYIYKGDKYDACVITHIVNGFEMVFPLTKKYPRLYFTFPLIGTEEIGIPIIINSIYFHPRVERDGVYLKKFSENANESINKEIVNNALSNYIESFAYFFTDKNIKGVFELFNLKLSKDLKWIDHDWFNQVKRNSINNLASKPVIRFYGADNTYTCLEDLKIPYSTSQENTRLLWDLLTKTKKIRLPTDDEIDNWVIIADNISKLSTETIEPHKLKFVWGLKMVISFVEEQESLVELQELLNIDVNAWLNDLYSTVVKISNTFPLDHKIVLNQDNKLQKAEGMSWDKVNDDTLISISNLIGLNYAKRLISRKINPFYIAGVDNFTLQDAIGELKSNFNNLTESDFSRNELLKGNAEFLKWLITQKQNDTIKDLKVLTGGNKRSDEVFIYDHFPKSEHLLLSPKPFFENQFPIYSNLIRDKDCLNEVYNIYLNSADYKFLSDNGFIHYLPLVIKNDYANLKLLELLIINENDLNLLRDNEGQLKFKFKITYTDFAYLTATDGHIYSRNSTQKSSLERFKFLLVEAVEKDPSFEIDKQDIVIEGIEKPIPFKRCLWVYRAKRLSWINVKSENDNSEVKFVSETPSSKNLSELLKGDEQLIKKIRGSNQQLLLNKLGIGVSDLIRNTLSNDKLRISWDKAITNLITSDVDPDLVHEIFNDPYIKKEYEKRLNHRKLIKRNQTIGKLVEDLFKEYLEQLSNKEFSFYIKREPIGSDYIITEDSSDFVNDNNEREGFKINNWLIELKATGKDYAAMTPLQAKIATENKDNYALIVVPLDGNEPDIEYIRVNAKVIHTIGYKINNVIKEFNDVELKKSILNAGKDGISVSIEDQNIRFRVSSTIWSSIQVDIESFMKTQFSMTKRY